ncbi:hypothetical protein [Achromobacter sp. ACM05]|uniref:hypothetical protein n=1 Tax=Achromobacter sp. ACM05 TaxID=2854776 RepID=UPI001C467743|nr:hypothetical protein [Achromobacter sp. ACM05]MBV7502062.1 hypothetical protein [Achromobacter sp. ACM05]
MNTDKDGGNAFPVPGLQDDPDFNGLSVRDYFAAKAMQGFNANPTPEMLTWSLEKIAKHSYRQADAMLAARGET